MKEYQKKAIWLNNGGIVGIEGGTSDDAVCIVGRPNEQTLEDTELAHKICEWHNTKALDCPLTDILCGQCGRGFYIDRVWQGDVYCPYCRMTVFAHIHS